MPIKKPKILQAIFLINVVFLFLDLSNVFAGGLNEIRMNMKYGYVMARAVVTDENGQPILVKYNDDGSEAGEIEVPADYKYDVRLLRIEPATSYLYHKKQLDDFIASNPGGLAASAELLTSTEFLAGSYKTADNVTPIDVGGSLSENVASVLIKAQASRINADVDDLIIMRFPYDMTELNSVYDSSVSLLVTPEGQILEVFEQAIGYRTGFFGKPDEPQPLIPVGGPANEEEVFGAVAGVKVSLSDSYLQEIGGSGYNGKYIIKYNLPVCPVGGFEFTTDVYAELHYRNFLPMGAEDLTYYIRRQAWDYCYAQFIPTPLPGAPPAYVETDLDTLQRIDIFVDVMMLSGKIEIRNLAGEVVAIGDNTSYSSFTEEESDSIPGNFYDFDGNGELDTVAPGAMLTERMIEGSCVALVDAEGSPIQEFVTKTDFCDTNQEADMQGVYLDSIAEQPSFVRLIDKEKRINEETDNIGLLKTISLDDYKNTDILIFRESTGQLVMERRGLRDEEVNQRASVLYDSEEQQIAYRVMFRGPKDTPLNIGGGSRQGSFSDWSARSFITEPFAAKESHHLRPGENIVVVAINRATGYVGTQRVELGSVAETSSIGLEAPIITMTPPNIKIWAEREYSVQKGITAGANAERQYLIGTEGAALTSDDMVIINTEWLDADGSPLPDGLSEASGAQYGLTGRLAKVVDNNYRLGAAGVGSGLSEFPIAPGRKIQAITVSSNLSSAEHYYVHVIGKPRNQECPSFWNCPNFESIGLHNGAEAPYDVRPRYLTPFYVPLFNEAKHWEDYNAYRELQRGFDPADPDSIDPLKPLPAYSWLYRPEYQFSQFELEMQKIETVQLTEEGETRNDVLEAGSPINADVDFIEALYSLLRNDFSLLTPLDGERQLVFAFGEEEQIVTFGADQTIRFDNISHLASLDPEDFLSMRLYTNNDAGNILWEYAFEHLVLDTQLVEFDSSLGLPLYVSADDPAVKLTASLVGYSHRNAAVKEPMTLRWHATPSGISPQAGVLETTVETNSDQGVFLNEIIMPKVAGAVSDVAVTLVGMENSRATLPPIVVVAGAPANIEHSQSGASYVGGHGLTTVTVTITDAHGNLVEDGTGVSFMPIDGLLLEEYDESTTQGMATASFAGSAFTSSSKVQVVAGDAQALIDVNVHALDVDIQFGTAEIEIGQQRQVQVTVTTPEGESVSDIEVELGSTYGFVQESSLVTDANGQVQTSYTAPQNPGSGIITARVGMLDAQSVDVEVIPPGDRPFNLNTRQAAFVGNEAVDGVAIHERFDDVNISVPYQVSGKVTVTGADGEITNVELGNQFDKNLAPLAAWHMNSVYEQQVEDDAGQIPLNSIGVVNSISNRLGAGTSFGFINDPEVESKLWADNVTRIQLENNFGFSLEVLPRGANGGEIVNLGQGAVKLTYENSRLAFSIRTESGMYSISSETLLPGRWYQVAADYQNDQIILHIGDDSYAAAATGVIDYQNTGNSGEARLDPTRNHDLVLGGEFFGNLNNLQWYNLTSQPLLVFDNGSTEKSIAIDAAGSIDVAVLSTGNMHTNGSQLDVQRIAVSTASTSQYVTIVSRAAFARLAGIHVNSLADDVPPINELALQKYQEKNSEFAGNLLMSVAYAQDGGSSFFDFGLLNWILPIHSLKVVGQQLAYVTGISEGKFDPIAFTLATLDVISFFPPAKGLAFVVKPLQGFCYFANRIHPRFMTYMGTGLVRVMSKAKAGDFNRLWNTLPFLVLGATLYFDDEARDGLVFMISTIDSVSDFFAWVDYTSLPGVAWEGDQVPEVDPFAVEENVGVLRSLFLPEAQAARVLPVSAGVLASALRNASQRITGELKENIPDALAQTVKHIKAGDGAALRGQLFSASAITSTTGVFLKGGSRALRNFLTGRTNARYKQITILATVAYLEWETACGKALDQLAGDDLKEGDLPRTPEELAAIQATLDTLECNSIGIRGGANRKAVYRLYFIAFGDTLSGNYDEELPARPGFRTGLSGHGALFHMNQVASHMLAWRAGGPKVKAIEGYRRIWLYKNQAGLNAAEAETNPKSPTFKNNIHAPHSRWVDIILEDQNGREVWVELKSYKATAVTGPNNAKLAATSGRPIAAWNLAKGDAKTANSALNKQFSLDKAVKNVGHARLKSDENKQNQLVEVSDFVWYFQKFKWKPKGTATYKEVSPDLGSGSNKDGIRWQLNQPVSGYNGNNKDIYETNFDISLTMTSHVKEANLKTFLTQLAKAGFSGAADALLEELAENPDL